MGWETMAPVPDVGAAGDDAEDYSACEVVIDEEVPDLELGDGSSIAEVTRRFEVGIVLGDGPDPADSLSRSDEEVGLGSAPVAMARGRSAVAMTVHSDSVSAVTRARWMEGREFGRYVDDSVWAIDADGNGPQMGSDECPVAFLAWRLPQFLADAGMLERTMGTVLSRADVTLSSAESLFVSLQWGLFRRVGDYLGEVGFCIVFVPFLHCRCSYSSHYSSAIVTRRCTSS